MSQPESVKEYDLALNADLFLRQLIRELSGKMEELVGLEEAEGFISLVGQSMARWINEQYANAAPLPNISASLVANICVDLKRRIKGDFYIVSIDEEKIEFRNRRCPFGDKVLGRTSMCMMTSNVFGYIASHYMQYGKVILKETIAKGDEQCHVVVYFTPSDNAQQSDGREYYKAE